MTQYVFDNITWRAGTDWRGTNANREIDAKAWWSDFRDSFRAAMVADVTLKVGDIFRWLGATGKYGHGFIIRHSTKGEWLIMGSAEGTLSSDAAYLSDILQNTWTNYLRRDQASSTSTSSFYSGLTITYNPVIGSSWDIGYDANLALTSGDWTAPTSNPYSAIASFWSATSAPLGMALTNSGFQYNVQTIFHILIDTDYGILRLDTTIGSSTFLERSTINTRVILVCGEGFDTFANNGVTDSGDTNYAVTAFWVLRNGGTDTSSAVYQEAGVPLIEVAYYMSAGGSRISDGAPVSAADRTYANYKALSGKPITQLVEVRSPSVIKGNLKAAVALEAFPYRAGRFYGQIITWPNASDNRLIKEHGAFCLIWVKGKTAWPYPMDNSELP